MKNCYVCDGKPCLKRSKTGLFVCKQCFINEFEKEVHDLIISKQLFCPGETIALAVSGGKDSCVMAHVLKVLNARYNYGLNMIMIAVDEGIQGYRDDSLTTLKITQEKLDLPLTVVSYKDLYGWTMDEIVKVIGRKNNCILLIILAHIVVYLGVKAWKKLLKSLVQRK